jgi:hypothetical protein
MPHDVLAGGPAGEPASRDGFRIAILLFALAWLILCWPWLSGRLTVPWDAKAHFQAQLQFLASSLHRGDWPFWNPFVFSGSPQVADPQSLIFSPPHLLVALADPAPSFSVADAISFAMLGLGGMALIAYFRDRGWRAEGALVAALVFAFGASAAWRIQHTGQILSLSWWAMTLWCLSRALERRSVLWGAAAGIAGGCMVIGRDQVALLGAFLLVFQTLWFVLDGPRRLDRVRGTVLPIAAGALAGIVVAGLPIAMTLLLAGDSNRPAIDFDGAGRGSLHPASLLTAFAANLYGTDGPLREFWGQPSFIWGPTDLFLARNMGDVYVGALPLLAILVLGGAAGAFAARQIRWVAAAFVLVLCYALGWYTPVFTLYWHILPGIDLFRRPADATFLLGGLAAILAGYAVHCLRAGTIRLTRWELAGGAVLIAAGFLSCAGVALLKGRLGHAAPAIGSALAFTLVSAAVLAWLGGRRPPAWAGCLALAALLAADLGWNNGPNESTALPPELYDVLRPDSTDPIVAEVKRRLAAETAPDRRDRVELAGVDFHWPNASMVHGLDNTLGYNPLRLAAYSRATGAQDTVALPEQRTFSALMPGWNSTLANVLGLRYVVTRGPAEDVDKALKEGDLVERARAPHARLFENPRALPRVLLVGQARATDDDQLLETGQWPDGFDPRTTVLLDPADGEPVFEGSQRPPGTARLVHYANTEVVVSVDAPQGGWLVLNDSWHPWWYATVDGVPATVRRANGIVRAVQVAPGAHEVRFTFRTLRGLADEIAERWGGSHGKTAR